MMTKESVQVNDLLREVRDIDKETVKLETQIKKLQNTINQLHGRQEALANKLYPLREKQKRLVKAADALTFNTNDSDWREWPWVKNSGFVERLPHILI